MAYFSNGSEGDMYEAINCERCLHYEGCVIWELHLELNYDECNKPDSFLHRLIPRSADGLGNELCKMFIQNPHYGQRELL